MTVQDVIDQLLKIKNKQCTVYLKIKDSECNFVTSDMISINHIQISNIADIVEIKGMTDQI